MKFVVDRIEENTIVVELENGKIVNVPREFLQFMLEEGRQYKLTLNVLPKKEKIKEKFDSLFE